jgi:hypothetical protein
MAEQLCHVRKHTVSYGWNCFGSWILLQVKKGKGQKPYLLGHLVKRASDLNSYNIEVPGVKKLWMTTIICGR